MVLFLRNHVFTDLIQFFMKQIRILFCKMKFAYLVASFFPSRYPIRIVHKLATHLADRLAFSKLKTQSFVFLASSPQSFLRCCCSE